MTETLLPPCWLVARQAWGFGASAYAGETAPRRIKQLLRWSFLAAMHPYQARRWFGQLNGRELAAFRDANPILAFRPLRAYLSSRWSMARRAEVIGDTYRVAQLEGGALRAALLGGQPVLLAKFELNDLGAADLRLGVDDRFRREGELSLSLHCETLGGRVMSVAFSLEEDSCGCRKFYIGCLQGRGDIAAGIKAITKAMHGLRPRALLVIAMQEVARATGGKLLLGASNRIQVNRRKHLIHLPYYHALAFDYDTFWKEAGGDLSKDGWYHLPPETPRRAAAEIKTNKRSQYARRYAMLDDLERQFACAFARQY